MVKTDPVEVLKKTGYTKLTAFTHCWLLIREIHKHLDSVLYKNAKISAVQVFVLHSLVTNNGVMNPTSIARWLGTQRHNITTLIRRMEKSELVRIERDNKNKRQVNVILTDKGRSVFEETGPIASRFLEDIMSSVTDEGITQMQSNIESMSDNLTKEKNQS